MTEHPFSISHDPYAFNMGYSVLLSQRTFVITHIHNVGSWLAVLQQQPAMATLTALLSEKVKG